jgi:hypothetical protein
MTNPITDYRKYLAEITAASEALLNANGLRGTDPFFRTDDESRPLPLGDASTNAVAHALGSAYLAYDHSPIEAAALGWGREFKSYFLHDQGNTAWDTFKDLYNNRVGRNIADYARRNNLSRDQIQDLILDALSSGKLIVTHEDPRIDPSFNGNPLNFRLPTGDGVPWTSPSAGFSDFSKTVTRVPVAPGNESANPILRHRSAVDQDVNLDGGSVALAIPGAGGPTSVGGPSGPTPLMPPENSGSRVPGGPGPSVAPLQAPHFAPEILQNFGPFAAPAPSRFDASGGLSAVQKPGGLAGMMIDTGLIPNWEEVVSAPISSPDLVEKWMRHGSRTPGAGGLPTTSPQTATADSSKPFGMGGQFVPGSAASLQPLDDTRSFAVSTDSPADADDAKNIRFLRRVTLAPDGSLLPDPLPASD